MQSEDITAIIIISILSAVIITISIIMLTGKGANLIAGYNTLSREEKEKFDAKKLSVFLGKVFLLIGILFNCISVGIVFCIRWLPFAVAAAVAAAIIFAAVSCNTGNRFKKQ